MRGRKRRQTRTAIAKSAMQLFAQHGFDQVSVAQIAAAAGVAEKTVYNYFPAKADMFFDEASDILAVSRRSACWRQVWPPTPWPGAPARTPARASAP